MYKLNIVCVLRITPYAKTSLPATARKDGLRPGISKSSRAPTPSRTPCEACDRSRCPLQPAIGDTTLPQNRLSGPSLLPLNLNNWPLPK